MSTDLPEVAGERAGGSVIACSDEFFGAAQRLISPEAPVARPTTYDDHGLWMDGWETRRHRAPSSDWVIVRLGAPTVVRTIVVDTSFFDGNQPQSASLDGASVPGNPTPEQVLAATWTPLRTDTLLAPNSHQAFPVQGGRRITHVRLTIHPDGGVARLRVHGEVLLDPRELDDGLSLDLAAASNGGVVQECSDMHFGNRGHLVAPGEARTMGDGWQTRRRLKPGEDWAVVRLAVEGLVQRVVVDTRRFRGNAPQSCLVQASTDRRTWTALVEEVPLQPDQVHVLPVPATPARWLRLTVRPDGGVARLHAWGTPTPAGRAELALRWLDALPVDELERVLLAACGSTRFAGQLAAQRPFTDLLAQAQQVWRGLDPDDWEQALAAHPRIGEQPPPGSQERREQAAADSAGSVVMEQIALGNAAYEQRFGRRYVVRAAGRSAEQMLALLQERLGNDPDTELRTAADQQGEILQLRLARLVGGP